MTNVTLNLPIDIIRCQNTDNGSFIKPYLTILFYIIFEVGLDGSTIYLNFHRLICFQWSCYHIVVSEYVDYGLDFDQDHVQMSDRHRQLLHYYCPVQTGWISSVFPFLERIFHVIYSSPCRYNNNNHHCRYLYSISWVLYFTYCHICVRLYFIPAVIVSITVTSSCAPIIKQFSTRCWIGYTWTPVLIYFK